LNIDFLLNTAFGNPDDYFDRNFMDYKNGFQSKGETWMGLEALHQLTSQGSWSLHIKMVDYDQNAFVAVYDQFKVGPGDDYTLNVGQYNQDLSTLGDSLNSNWTENNINGMKFTTWDKDQDGWSSGNCASRWSGGWWYNRCMHAHPTGLHSPTKVEDGAKYIFHYHCAMPCKYAPSSFAEAEYLIKLN